MQLLEMLNNLGDEELKHFQFYLQTDPGNDFPKVFKRQLENADRLKTVTLVLRTYAGNEMEVASSILKRMNEGRTAQYADSILSQLIL